MIGQCLSNKNESATVSKCKKFLHLNKPKIATICALFDGSLTQLIKTKLIKTATKSSYPPLYFLHCHILVTVFCLRTDVSDWFKSIVHHGF